MDQSLDYGKTSLILPSITKDPILNTDLKEEEGILAISKGGQTLP
jgi:hypothetical protein